MRKIAKLLGFVSLSVISLLTLFALLLPILLKTSYGNQTIVSWINKDLPGNFLVKEISISWFGKQTLSDIRYQNQDKSLSFVLKNLEINASLPKILIDWGSIQEIVLKDFEAEITEDLKQPLKLKNGFVLASIDKASLLSVQGNADLFNGDAENFSIEAKLSLNNFLENAQISIKNLPSALIDAILSISQGTESKLAQEIFGKQISMSLNTDAQDLHQIRVDSDNLKGEVLFKILNGALISQGQSEFSLLLTPEMISSYFSLQKKTPFFKIEKNTQISLDLISFNIANTSVEALDCDFSLKIPQADIVFFNPLFSGHLKAFNGLFSFKNGSLKTETSFSLKNAESHADIKISGNTSDKLNVQILGPILLANDQGGALFNSFKIDLEMKKGDWHFESALNLKPILPVPYHEIASENFELFAKGQAHFNEGGISLQETALKADSENHHFDALFKFANNKIELLSPASLRLKILPQAINNLEFAKNGSFNLKKPLEIVISMTPADYSIDLKELENINLIGSLKMDLLDFFSYGNEFVFKDVFAPFEYLSEEKRLKLSPTLKTYVPKFNKEGAIAGKISFKDAKNLFLGDFSKAQGKAWFQLLDFPTEILDSLTHTNFSGFLGPILSLDLDAQYEKSLNVLATLRGKELEATLSLTTDENLSLMSDQTFAEVNFTLDQEKLKSFTALIKDEELEPHFTLLEKSPAKIVISSLNYSIPKKGSFLSELGFNLDLHIDKFFLHDLKRKQSIRLSDVMAKVNTKSLKESVSLSFEALPENGDRAKGTLSISAMISHLLTIDGKWNYENAALEGKISALSFKSAAFCDLFCPYPAVSPKLEALIGNLLDADIRFNINQMSGPVFANIRGGNGMMKFNGRLQSGFLYLNEPLIAEVKATSALGTHILKDFVPFLQGLESSSSPIRFTLYNEGFAFPVKDFNVQAIAIKEASLETGKMVFKNSHELSSLINLLNGEQKERQTIWLTPVYFSMKEGKIKLKRADMLVSDTYHFASWGLVDLGSERVDMIVGVAGNTISKALGVAGLKRDSMLQIPYKGPLSNPKLDKTRAAAKISSLVASKQGPEGLILGTFIDLASGGFLEQDPPPATTKPFPWGEIADAADETSAEKEKKHEKTVFSPLEEIEKGSKNLLKKIFQ